jgi:signal transduction histidine kinase/ActR/RegA family two-component response regulator
MEQEWQSRRRLRLLGWVATSLGVVCAAVGWWTGRAMEDRRIAGHFREAAAERVTAIESALKVRLSVVDALTAFFAGSQYVDRDEFETFSTRLLIDNPELLALEWAPRVTAEDRSVYERAVQWEGYSAFQIQEFSADRKSLTAAGSRHEYYPVHYISPLETFEYALGFDLLSEPACRKALETAVATGKVAMSRLIRVYGQAPETVPPRARRPSLLAALPVYEALDCADSVEREHTKQDCVAGVVVALFEVDLLAARALAGLSAFDGTIALWDASKNANGRKPIDRLVYTLAGDETLFADSEALPKTSGIPLARHPLRIGDQQWEIVVVAHATFGSGFRGSEPEILLISILVVTALVWSLFQFALGQEALIGSAVRERAETWIESNRRLEVANRALEESARAATASNRSKSQFVANMSHEIRTPLTAILGFAEVLLEEGDMAKAPQVRIEALTSIQRNGGHLLALINDVLDLSKIESGRISVERVSCSPLEIVADVVAMHRGRAESKDVALALANRGPIPSLITTDPTCLRQILINLVGNAVKFTESGSVRLELWLDDADGAPRMCFDILDSGIGISADEAGRLFESFQQVDNSMSRRFGGTGLGLTISRRVAQLLGGDVTLVESAPGAGSRFRATIGAGDLSGVAMLEEAPTWANPSQAEAVAESTEKSISGMRILLAEDGIDNQRLIGFYLRKADATVYIVDNGEAAFEQAMASSKAGSPYDVVLMDMQMPVMDGYEATRRLRNRGYAGAIIALTAHNLAGDREKCLEAGCNDYAAKPIHRELLLKAIARRRPGQESTRTRSKATSPMAPAGASTGSGE